MNGAPPQGRKQVRERLTAKLAGHHVDLRTIKHVLDEAFRIEDEFLEAMNGIAATVRDERDFLILQVSLHLLANRNRFMWQEMADRFAGHPAFVLEMPVALQ